MLSYKEFTKYFGTSLFDKGFQTFLSEIFSDLTEYDILESDYITSDKNGIELGFTNKDAIYDDDENVVFEKGNPIFSHFNIYLNALTVLDNLPFDTYFDDNRNEIKSKTGNPTQTKKGSADFLNKRFLVDNYKVDNIIITFDYDAEKEIINFIQVCDNNLREHLKL